MSEDLLTIAGKTYASRLLIGTGKYKDFEETRDAIEASGAEIVTVALRRTNLGQNPDEPNLLDFVSPERYTILPNTAGCFNAEDAVRTCKLARELLDGHSLLLIMEQAKVPIIVDAGVGTPSDATLAMELGCDGVLLNSAVAHANKPVLMAGAMKKAIEAGREGFLAGRMPKRVYANPSSPGEGLI
jgi:thiazole synthase ThiGH ThiG subunit